VYGKKDMMVLNTRVRFSTMFLLLENEKILELVCGWRNDVDRQWNRKYRLGWTLAY